MTSRLLVGGIGLMLVVGLFSVLYFTGHRAGVAQERAVWVERERIRDDAVAVAQKNQALAMDRLNVEIETLRARPERIRTVTKLVTVEADQECASLPENWRNLWNAE